MPSIWRTAVALCLPILFAACTLTPNTPTQTASNKPKLLAAQTYIQMAAQTADQQQQQNYRLLALERFVQDKKATQALATIKTINSNTVNSEQQAQLQLLYAELQLARHHTNSAVKILQFIQSNNAPLNTDQQIKLHRLMADAYAKSGKIVDSLTEYSSALPLIQNQSVYHHEVTTAWKLLQQQNLPTLQAMMNQNPSPMIQGWLQLAALSHQPNANGKALIRDIALWRQAYRDHPANNLLPKRIDDNNIVTQDIPKNVAILLPLSGALKLSATAIRNGFLAAYFEAKNNGQRTPNLYFYDTTQGSINDIYQVALQNGADFIVGPLTKPNVERLITSDQINRPTLALNTVSSSFDVNRRLSLPNHLYQFGLSPIDEAIQIADIAHAQRHNNVLIIAPDNTRGQEVAQAISLRWQQLGGDVVADLAYGANSNLSHSIQSLLTIDQSHARSKTLEKTIGQTVRSLPRRRQDIDCIFLVANPTFGRQIQPLLKYFFAGDLPIFATSEIYSGDTNKNDQDLDEVMFTDMPWVLSNTQQLSPTLAAIQTQLNQLYPKSFRQYNKLYALGVDAYNLMTELNMLAIFPQLGTTAATGTLYLDEKRHLYRQLRLAQIADGQPRMIDHG